MAKLVLKDAYVLLNAVNLSGSVRSVSISSSADMVDGSVMSLLTKYNLAGLKDWVLSITFAQDFAAANVDATMFPLVGTSFAIEIRPTSAARSATNPAYTGTGILESYTPIAGSVGALLESPVSIRAASDLVRAIV